MAEMVQTFSNTLSSMNICLCSCILSVDCDFMDQNDIIEELSWCQLCRHWWQRRLSWWQGPCPSKFGIMIIIGFHYSNQDNHWFWMTTLVQAVVWCLFYTEQMSKTMLTECPVAPDHLLGCHAVHFILQSLDVEILAFGFNCYHRFSFRLFASGVM